MKEISGCLLRLCAKNCGRGNEVVGTRLPEWPHITSIP